MHEDWLAGFTSSSLTPCPYPQYTYPLWPTVTVCVNEISDADSTDKAQIKSGWLYYHVHSFHSVKFGITRRTWCKFLLSDCQVIMEGNECSAGHDGRECFKWLIQEIEVYLSLFEQTFALNTSLFASATYSLFYWLQTIKIYISIPLIFYLFYLKKKV